jgi:phage gp36-like protein
VYATPDDVRAVVARSTSAGAGTSASALSDPVLIEALASAEAEVDARLASRYGVPFADVAVPALVRSLTVDVAAYLATLTFRESTDLGQDDPIRLRFARAQDLLGQLAKGDLDLPGVTADDGSPAPAGRPRVLNTYEGRMFGLRDFGLGYGRDRRCG